MVIALLAVLGVDLMVIVALVGVVLARRGWVSRKPGAFKGSIRVTDGEVHGLRPKWKRGSGRWARDVLVWTKAPTLLRSEVVEVDRVTGAPRAAVPADNVKRLGSAPVIVALVTGSARIEVATASEHSKLALGRFDPVAQEA